MSPLLVGVPSQALVSPVLVWIMDAPVMEGTRKSTPPAEASEAVGVVEAAPRLTLVSSNVGIVWKWWSLGDEEELLRVRIR